MGHSLAWVRALSLLAQRRGPLVFGERIEGIANASLDNCIGLR
jgi:hypothetical protein